MCMTATPLTTQIQQSNNSLMASISNICISMLPFQSQHAPQRQQHAVHTNDYSQRNLDSYSSKLYLVCFYSGGSLPFHLLRVKAEAGRANALAGPSRPFFLWTSLRAERWRKELKSKKYVLADLMISTSVIVSCAVRYSPAGAPHDVGSLAWKHQLKLAEQAFEAEAAAAWRSYGPSAVVFAVDVDVNSTEALVFWRIPVHFERHFNAPYPREANEATSLLLVDVICEIWGGMIPRSHLWLGT